MWDDEASFFNGESRSSDAQRNSRFTVLHDKVILQSDSGTKLTRIKTYKRLHHHVAFTGTGATASAQGLGSIWIITASSEATNTPILCLKTTFKWIDN